MWGLAAASVVAVLVVSLSRGSTEEWPLRGAPIHVALYASLTFWLLCTVVWAPYKGRGRFPRAAPYVVMFATALGVFAEMAQNAVETRTPDPWDALADAVGVAIGALLWIVLRSFVRWTVQRIRS